MGITLLADVLISWDRYGLDELIYLTAEAKPSLNMIAVVLPFDTTKNRRLEGLEAFLGIEQLRDVIEGLEAQLGRSTTPSERLRAAIHYMQHDAFIDPSAMIEG